MLSAASLHVSACLQLSRAISTTRTVEDIYDIALDALRDGLGVSRSSILLFDPDGVMRFKAFRGLSSGYRAAVEGHTPWTPDCSYPDPIVVADVTRDASLAPYLHTIQSEGIAAMAFIPLVSAGRVIGKFMLYYERPTALGPDEIQLASLIAGQVAFAVERTRTEEQARRNEARLRFALDAAAMGTWDWDLVQSSVRWSDNIERMHGLPEGTLDGTFASYERAIHPEDRDRVRASMQQAIADGVPYDVEYRIVGAGGAMRWVEGKGHVEYDRGTPVRMTGVCMLVTRRKELELARLAAAEETSRLKDEFLATLSHEVRTPLNAILGWVQMLESGGLPPERHQQAIEVIGRNARQQAALIEDILDVSRIITGKLDIDRVPLILTQLVESVVASTAPAAAARGIDIVKDVPDDLPVIDGDPKRLQQVLGNVLSNALKFTPRGGRIEIGGAAVGAWVEIRVRDTGVGIAPEFLPFVFDRFRQADSGTTRRQGGLGLGLAIARHLVEQHGGVIGASSHGLGAGTTVVVRLPVEAHVAVTRAPQLVGHSPDTWARSLHGLTVVVVDDQRDSRELLATLLRRCGAEVIECPGAGDALTAVSTREVDLLVADIAMPDMDGYALMTRVRQSHPSLPAVAVSAYARREDRASALEAGFTAFCAKPIETSAFLATVSHAIRPS